MMRSLSRGLAALTVLLLGASIASAFPVNNITDTDANGPGLSGFSFALRSVVTGASHNAVGNVARQFTTIVRSGTTPAPGATTGYLASDLSSQSNQQAVATAATSYAPINPRNWQTFCVELTEGLNQNNRVTAIEAIPPAIALPDGVGYIPIADQGPALERAAWLIANRNLIASAEGVSNADVIGAATQIAIWEIVYEAGLNQVGNVLTQGGPVINGNATGFRANAGSDTTRQAALTLANKLLAQSVGQRYGGRIFRSGVVFAGLNASGEYLYNDDTIQSQTVIAAVPEPSTLAVAGLTTLGLLGYGLRRRSKARA